MTSFVASSNSIKYNKKCKLVSFKDILDNQTDIEYNTLSDNYNSVLDGSFNMQTQACSAHNGLVSTVLDAYNKHYHLVLRPDDVWQAVLTQFCFYFNSRAEELRTAVVNFSGDKTLVATQIANIQTANYTELIWDLVIVEMRKMIKDSTIIDWLLPNFSTSTDKDRLVAAITTMSTFQSFFKYKMQLMCGIPKVTLKGTVEDWTLLKTKIQSLTKFDGSEQLMTKWVSQLIPICNQFISSYDNVNIVFWDTVVSHIGGGSSAEYISGWLSVFSVFDNTGIWRGDNLSVLLFNNKTITSTYPIIDFTDLADGCSQCPLIIDDNGVEHNAIIHSGQIASDFIDDAIYPRSDWHIELID